jgi:hypothetical protein
MKRDMNWWCDRAWIIFGCWITAFMTALIMIFWNTWSTELKVIAAIAALIPIHVVEEWVFPGGFHFQYNTFLYKSDQPDRYPMCRKSDMITNLEATFMYMILTLITVLYGREVKTGVIMGTIGFCILEVFLHTLFGTMAFFKYRTQGKQTIYGPGSITAYLGFGVFGVILCYGMQGRTIATSDWIICGIILAIIAFCCILIPENIIKKKDNDYFFRTDGYYERYKK